MNTAISTFIKSLFRTAIDGCILPGTMTGTEILWLYVKQWKGELSTLSFAVLSVLVSLFEPYADQTLAGDSRRNEQESLQ
jgi:hypothetical protein